LLPRRVKELLHFMDKAGIYLLIAGSYTPFLVILFPDKLAWSQVRAKTT
jgi:channel protein (hemolysin III family)